MVSTDVVTLSLGRETYGDNVTDTYQDFFESEKYDIKTDIGTLEKILTEYCKGSDFFCERVSENELLLTHKKEIILGRAEGTLATIKLDRVFKRFVEYIKNRKRTVFLVYMTRSIPMLPDEDGGLYGADPIVVGDNNYVRGYIVGAIDPKYICAAQHSKLGESFVVTRQAIENLDKDSFRVYILKESENKICYEIINKNL